MRKADKNMGTGTGATTFRLEDPREDKSPPTKERLPWIVSMMWDAGMYTQAREVQRLGDAFYAQSATALPEQQPVRDELARLLAASTRLLESAVDLREVTKGQRCEFDRMFIAECKEAVARAA